MSSYSNSEQVKLSKIQSSQAAIDNLRNNSTYKYVDVKPSMFEKVRVGPIVNDEDHLNSGYLTTTQRWTVKDGIDMCSANTNNIYSNIRAKEDADINSGKIPSRPGLYGKYKSSNGMSLSRDGENTAWFDQDLPIRREFVEDFNTTFPGSTACDYFGCFVPSKTGIHTFTICNADIYSLWITDDNAVRDFRQNNADINNKTPKTNGTNVLVLNLRKNVYYSFRLQIASLSQNVIPSPILSVRLPDGSVITGNNNTNKYFVTLLNNDNSIYHRSLLYYALTEPNVNGMFSCYIVDMTHANFDVIHRLKRNSPIQYIDYEVNTNISYTKDYNLTSQEYGVALVNKPDGMNMKVNSAKYGVFPDRVVNQPYSTTKEVPETETIQVPHTELNTDGGQKANGLSFSIYSGYFNDDVNYFNNNKDKITNTGVTINMYNLTSSTNGVIKKGGGDPHLFSVEWFGYFYPNKDGNYGFATVSDDASYVWIGDSAASNYNPFNAVVNNGGLHGMRKTEGYITLKANTYYPIRIQFGENWGYHDFVMIWYDGSNWTSDLTNNFFSLSPAFKTTYTQETVPVQPVPTVTTWNDNYVSVPSSYDVTNSSQNMVNSSGFLINPYYKGYNSYFGDPDPGIVKNFKMAYNLNENYNPDDPTKNISNHDLYLDYRGQAQIGYSINGVTTSIPFSNIPDSKLCPDTHDSSHVLTDEEATCYLNRYPDLHQSEPQAPYSQKVLDYARSHWQNNGWAEGRTYTCNGSVQTCSYTLQLTDDGKIVINDSNNNTVFDFQVKINSSDFNRMIVNPNWLGNPKAVNSISVGTKLSQTPLNCLISKNGKFKLLFESGKLMIRYCVRPYHVDNSTGSKIYYTDNKNVDYKTKNQIYYLYRAHSSHGITGKKYLLRTDNVDSIKTMEYLPNTSNEVLQFSSFSNVQGSYPLIKNEDLHNLINSNISNVNSDTYKYNIYNNTKKEDCSKTCQSDINCQHFFFMNTSTGGKCLIDQTATSYPIYTQHNVHPNIISSDLNMKVSKINTSCNVDYYPNGQVVPIVDYKDVESYDTTNKVHENNSFSTYYCSDDIFKSNNSTIQSTYESFSPICGSYSCIQNNLSEIQDSTNKYQQKQQMIADKYNIKNQLLSTNSSISNVINTDKYENKSADKLVGQQYLPELSSARPEVDLSDGIKEDVQKTLLQQNTIYTVGTITAATLLVLAIVLAKE